MTLMRRSVGVCKFVLALCRCCGDFAADCKLRAGITALLSVVLLVIVLIIVVYVLNLQLSVV